MTTLDLAPDFHQTEINLTDLQKTAFSVENGHYKFVCMPFDLKNFPTTIQRVMENILIAIQKECHLGYMDDITIFSPSVREQVVNFKGELKKIQD